MDHSQPWLQAGCAYTRVQFGTIAVSMMWLSNWFMLALEAADSRHLPIKSYQGVTGRGVNGILDGTATQICTVFVLSQYTSGNKSCRGNENQATKSLDQGWAGCHIPLWRVSEGIVLQGPSGGDVVPICDTGFGREISVFPDWPCSVLQLKWK